MLCHPPHGANEWLRHVCTSPLSRIAAPAVREGVAKADFPPFRPPVSTGGLNRRAESAGKSCVLYRRDGGRTVD